jgi:hypothetical protein
MRYTVQLQDKAGMWADVLYTDDPARAARLVPVAVESNPLVKNGRIVDQEQETEQRRLER